MSGGNYIALPFLPLKKNPVVAAEPFDSIVISEKRTYAEIKDVLGRYYYMPVELGGIWLPNEPIITITRQKNIIKTVVSGRQGTVKEQFSANDFSINMKIRAISETLDYPYDLVEELIELFEINEALDINSPITDILGITKVVIEEYTLDAKTKQNIQDITLNLISDDDFTAILI